MRISSKLISGFLTISLITCFVGTVGLYIIKTHHDIDQDKEVTQGIISNLNNILINGTNLFSDTYQLLALLSNAPSKQNRERIHDEQLEISASRTKLQQAMKDYLELVEKTSTEERSRGKQLSEVTERLIAAVTTAMKLESRSNRTVAMVNLEQTEHDFLALLEQRLHQEQQRVVQLGNQVHTIMHRTEKIIIAVTICSFLLALAIGTGFSRSIARRIERLQKGVRAIGSGNFDTVIDTRGFDELSDLGESFIDMAAALKYSQNEIIAGRNYLDNIINSMADSLIVIDPEGTISSVNPATCRMLGYSEQELVGKPFSLIGGDTHLAGLVRQGEERFYRNREGRLLTVAFSATTLRDAQGFFQGVVCLALDISARKKAEEALHETSEALHGLFSAAPIAIITLDNNLTVTKWNPAAEQIFGWSAEEVVGHPYQLLPQGDEQAFEVLCKIVREGMILNNQEVIRRHRDGRLLHINLSTAPLRDAKGEISGVIGILVDISEQKQAESKLQESFEFTKTVLNSLNDAVSIIDVRDLTIIDVNDAFLKEFCCRRDQVIGKSCHDVTHHSESPCRPPNDVCPLLETIASGSAATAEHLHQRWNGDRIYVEVTTAPIFAADGSINQVVHMARDISARKEAEKENIFLASIVQNIPDSVYAFDTDGRIISWNRGAERMLGFPKDEILGRDICTIIPEGLQTTDFRQFLSQLTRVGYLSGHITNISASDGRQVPVEMTAVTLRDTVGKTIGYAAISRDISERLQAEERLQHIAMELQQSNEEIKSFAYIVSHDLRAPLVNIRGFSVELTSSLADIDAMLESQLQHFDGKSRERLADIFQIDIPESMQFINSSIDRMDALITAILKLSRLGRSELNPEQLNLVDMVYGIIRTLTHQMEEHNVELTVNDLPDIFADRTALEQILGNLLDNAVKYLHPDRPGRIEISATQDNQQTTVNVCDNGRGIAAEDMHKVFEIFRRAGPQDVPGEGMGLAYVKALLRRCGGRIWCESEAGVGTTFSFTIPHSSAQLDQAA